MRLWKQHHHRQPIKRLKPQTVSLFVQMSRSVCGCTAVPYTHIWNSSDKKRLLHRFYSNYVIVSPILVQVLDHWSQHVNPSAAAIGPRFFWVKRSFCWIMGEHLLHLWRARVSVHKLCGVSLQFSGSVTVSWIHGKSSLWMAEKKKTISTCDQIKRTHIWQKVKCFCLQIEK